MKILKQFVPFLILGLILSGGNVLAQSKKEKEEKAKEVKRVEKELETKEKEFLQQKELEKLIKTKYLDQEKLKAIMEDQKRVQEEAFKKYHIAFEDFEVELDKIEDIAEPEIGYRVFQNRFPTLVTDYYGRTKESTSLTIRKTIEDLTFSTKFKYNVQEGSDSFHFVASGSVEDGSIMIKLVDPNNKTIHEFEVSPLADVNWSQNFKWDEENAKKNTGIWTIMVAAKGATGRYSVSVRAN
ncbi:MAG: hypothetical protein U9N86_13915 [Bacteroidota bacterium]|nr:hypothetical protein [Bacteroidota bacterium]